MQPQAPDYCLTGMELSSDWAIAAGWAVASIAVFGTAAVGSWSESRRKEREAYYRAEAVKKLAEIQHTPPPEVLKLIEDAMKVDTKPSGWPPPWARPAAPPATPEQGAARRQVVREVARVVGLVVAALGGGLLTMVGQDPAFAGGAVPLLIGIALFVYGTFLMPRS